MTTTAPLHRDLILSDAGRRLFISGEWRDAELGTSFPVLDPATRETLLEVADGTPADAIRALDAAVAGAEAWAATPPQQRAAILRDSAETMRRDADRLALLMTLEMGKPFAESRSEVLYAAQFLSWFSEEASRIGGTFRTAPDGHSRLLTMRQPVGPCLFVTPWNFPLAMGTRKLGPALAAGCTTIIKPAAQTPLSMLALAQILHDSGVPAGVVNVVPTTRSREVVAALLEDPRLRKLSFTGSTPVGKQLVAKAAENLVRTSMELGGNAPFIVFADADLPRAVNGAVLAKLRNNGEACTAANRFYVHRDVVDEFVEALTSRFRALTLGPGSDAATDVGPLIDDIAVAKCTELVDDAVRRGATAVVGGAAQLQTGSYFQPTILTDVPTDARIMHEEVFGPVAPIAVFDDEAEVLRLANDSPYGLASYIFTQDLNRAIRVSERLQAGMVGLNRGVLSNPAAPFGGVGASGFGREGGDEGIEEYVDVKYVALDASA